MAGQHAVVKGLAVLSPSIKQVTDSLGASKETTSVAVPEAAKAQNQTHAQDQTHAQEEFTFIMDDELMHSSAHAQRVESKVRTYILKKTFQLKLSTGLLGFHFLTRKYCDQKKAFWKSHLQYIWFCLRNKSSMVKHEIVEFDCM